MSKQVPVLHASATAARCLGLLHPRPQRPPSAAGTVRHRLLHAVHAVHAVRAMHAMRAVHAMRAMHAMRAHARRAAA